MIKEQDGPGALDKYYFKFEISLTKKLKLKFKN